MLRVSAYTTKTEIDIQGVSGNPEAAATGIEFGSELMTFAEAVASRNEDDLAIARARLLEAAGESVLVDAAGVAGNFQRMVRIADSMGIPIDDMQANLGKQVRQELGLNSFPGARNSLK